MLHSQYRWNIAEGDEEIERLFAEQLNISRLLASILVTRGIRTIKDAESFLYATTEEMHDPMLMLGMKEAVTRITSAVKQGEKILIYGDYDADGVSSTALMVHLMRKLNASYDIYIPHRSKEGYGLHNHAIDSAHKQGVSLIVTVDTGISAVKEIAHANELGIDVIVTDHHEPPEILPEAYTLVNPKIPGCPYPFKGLAGVGVAFKLAHAILGELPKEWMQIVAIGTVADLMPLTDENRILVRYGIEQMRQTSYPGIRALLKVSGVEVAYVTSTNIGFAMAPRINASGRLDHAMRAVTLLTTQNESEAEEIAEELDALNKERQNVVDDIVREADAQLQAKMQNGKLPDVIVLAGEGWNVGVVGIVASKILDRYYRPTIILGIDPETGNAKGSARSIPGFDIYEALTECSDVLDHYGGHTSAAGMSLHRDQLSVFEERLLQFASEVLEPEHFVPEMTVDKCCFIQDVPLQVIEELALLEPFGMGNPSPRFMFEGLKVNDFRKMGKDSKHLKLTLGQQSDIIEAVAFGKGIIGELVNDHTTVDVLAEVNINEWNGSRKPQLMLHDLRIPHIQLFDYRGTRDVLKEMVHFQKILEALPGYHSSQIAAVIQPSSPYKSKLNDTSLWVYDRNAGILPLNDLAKQNGYEAVRTLFMIESPETPSQLDRLFDALSLVENIVLFHGKMDKQERIKVPTREQFKTIYAFMLKYGAQPFSEEEILPILSRQTGCSVRMLRMVFDVFEELSFILRTNGIVTIVPTPPKRQLNTSLRYQELDAIAEMENQLFYASTPQLTAWIASRLQGVS
ncbi:single-stranded-DNA-specific exonuclease RecJ [Paenibacillus sediminis]|uniref:Single-stranded-DNA-specific exonuclease RecJ n=1 Tax=Paenibacillus sediminis TaxID=664909 RepID=A0ABS4GY15_9BACL|nr:single-stranded-DNA-specific exonuclease RecJ [Paenibacillus sediminis]MBP1935160.1 single-stranded-DNA-specific exonuclease [Paenibacillus sediminis]